MVSWNDVALEKILQVHVREEITLLRERNARLAAELYEVKLLLAAAHEFIYRALEIDVQPERVRREQPDGDNQFPGTEFFQ